MKSLYALLVAVDQYKADITPLRGCVKDINQIEEFIRDNYANRFNLNIVRLQNETATYENVINGFRSHLKKAGPDDTVWFHFSGHGCEEKTAPEFHILEPTGLEQTILCHNSSFGDIPNIADKELAALLHEISTKDINDQPKESPHIVVSLDSCHSGGGTRDIGEDLIMPRTSARSNRERAIESYYSGYYQRQGENISVPLSRHILLSACRDVETAGDSSQGGVFTGSLIQALKDTKGEINYADLFMRARSISNKARKFQTPQFHAIDSFNPYTRFLSGEALGKPDRYEVVKENGSWYIKCGAIHGLPTNLDANHPIEVDIVSPDPGNKDEGQAIIVSVGAQRSKLDMKKGAVNRFLDALRPGDDPYRGIILSFPASRFYVRIDGNTDPLNLIRSKWDDSRNINIAETTEEIESAKISIQHLDGKFRITDEQHKLFAYNSSDDGTDGAEAIIYAVSHIAKWYRTVPLRNENKLCPIKPWVELEVEAVDAKGESQVFSNGHVKIFATADNATLSSKLHPDCRYMFIRPKVTVKNAGQDLFFYFLELENDYGIKCREGKVPFRYESRKHHDPFTLSIPLWKNDKLAWGLNEHEDELTIHYKLIVTTEELDIHQLTQDPLKTDRGGTVIIEDDKISDEWWVEDLTITMIRQDNEVGSEKAINLVDGQIEIQPNQNVKAKVAVASMREGERSVDPIMAFAALDRPGMKLISFNTERSLATRNILELDQVQISDQSKLEEDPLEILIPKSGESEWALPIAFDGQHFVIVGDSVEKEGRDAMHIREIPSMSPAMNEDGQVENPFVPEMQDRSLFKAVKLAFFKLVLKKEEGLNELARIFVDSEDKVKQSKDGIGSEVAGAENILLVIHGLLGNTKSIVEDLLTSSPSTLKPYDLILGYDYENLNDPLKDSAAKLKDLLDEIKIDSGRKVTILAHGSGGLIARWMIEQEGGANFVDELIMVGTPNNGTVYGKIDSYRKFASNALDIAMNYIPNLIPGSGFILKALSTVTDLSGSLADMHPGSEFINQLNLSEDPGVPYTIQAGSIGKIESAQKGQAKMLARVSKKLGNLFQPGEAHDVFATVESVENRSGWTGRSPAPRILPVASSFHFNYFKNGISFNGNEQSASSDAPAMESTAQKAMNATDEEAHQSADEPDPEVAQIAETPISPEVKAAVLAAPEEIEESHQVAQTEEPIDDIPEADLDELREEIEVLKKLLDEKELVKRETGRSIEVLKRTISRKEEELNRLS